MHEQMHVVGFAVEPDQLDIQVGAHGVRMVCSHWGSMSSVNTGRRYLVTKHQMRVQRRHAVPGAAIGRGVGGHPYGGGVQTGIRYRIEPAPAAGPEPPVESKPRARKRVKGSPTHVRSWPLRPTAAQSRDVRERFFTGNRVYNAVLGEFTARSRAVKCDPGWQAARLLPHRTPPERKARAAAFRAVEQTRGFTVDTAQSFASSLRKSWVREHLPAQETQNLGVRAFDAVQRWHVRRCRSPTGPGTAIAEATA